MGLLFSPFRVFEANRSPAALYARSKWLGEADTPVWRHDFNETVSGLLKGQEEAGSWNQSALTTIRRLFGLHLTVRDATRPIMRGLDWLMDRIYPRSRLMTQNLREEITSEALRGLPLSTGRSDLLARGATLFLRSIFGRENAGDVLAAYDWLVD